MVPAISVSVSLSLCLCTWLPCSLTCLSYGAHAIWVAAASDQRGHAIASSEMNTASLGTPQVFLSSGSLIHRGEEEEEEEEKEGH